MRSVYTGSWGRSEGKSERGSIVPSLSAPQIFIAYSMKNRGVSDKNLRRGKAGYEAKGLAQVIRIVHLATCWKRKVFFKLAFKTDPTRKP